MPITHKFFSFFSIVLFLISFSAKAQEKEGDCPKIENKKAEKQYAKAITEYKSRNYSATIKMLKEIVADEPDFIDAYYLLGMIYVDKSRLNPEAAEKYLSKVIELCPNYNPYAYFYLGKICLDNDKYDSAAKYMDIFMKASASITSEKEYEKKRLEKDYSDAENIFNYSTFCNKVYKNPVPFDPKPVEGICTKDDEYLPIISPDDEMALFTRRVKQAASKGDMFGRPSDKEIFMYSTKEGNNFSKGEAMPYPFNQNQNEGGATLTLDNKHLYYTVCKYTNGGSYYNCDIYYSDFIGDHWTDIKSIGDNVNQPDTWETQPSVSADGNTIYFISDRKGGYGGYDIYKTTKAADGVWGKPVNLGNTINTEGNEKTPFIHSDSQTLYFSSSGYNENGVDHYGHPGLGGYDIFYSRADSTGKWSKPKNIGYPINTVNDETGFFVSTDGKYGYFSSNKLSGPGGWDVFYFDLYNEARPEKVMIVKGDVKNETTKEVVEAKVELKNASTKKITEIPVDMETGKFITIVPQKSDYILTVKKEGFAYETKFIAAADPESQRSNHLEVKPIEVGSSYKLNDIYFETNSFELNNKSKEIIESFIEFLKDNPNIKAEIQGHTDDVGNDKSNLTLSDNRARSVFDFIIQQGIASNRLIYKGYGKTKPIASNSNEEGRAKNRRTVFVITQK
ncbi:MAG: OmpA family protein [Bacteroidota bacterium]